MKNLLLTLCCAAFVLSCSQTDVYDVTRFGAKGDGVTNDATAIQKAIDLATEKGGVVVFPSGKTFLSGPIELKSHVEYRFEPGSVLLADPDESLYTRSAFGENRGEGMCWIWAQDAEGISITGTGRIDGNGVAFMAEELDDSYDLKPLVDDFDPRPHVMTLYGVKGLRIHDVTVANSAYWTIHLGGCYDVVIDGITIANNLKIRNGDGIDIDHSRKVRIANCFIESGDDSICLKNRRELTEYGPCEDIVIQNCVMESRSCAVKFGSENVDRIANVLIDNCIIRGGNRALGIQNRDEGTITNVVFSNILIGTRYYSDTWWGKAEPIYVTAFPRKNAKNKDGNWRFPPGATVGSCGEVSDIVFRDIRSVCENGVFVSGDTIDKVHDITFERVDLHFVRQSEYEGGIYDRRPCNVEEFIHDDTYGFYLDNASRISILDCSVESREPAILHYGGPIKQQRTREVTVRNLR